MADTSSKITELFTKKGPANLPVGVWILLGGGGLFFIYRTYKKNGSATPNVASTGTTGNGTIDATGMGTYSPAGGNIQTSDTGANASGNSFADNNAWANAAINYLVGLGYDAGTVNQAIGLYLASQPMTTTQMQAMVNVAIQHLGPPPMTVAPVNGNVPPVQGGSGGTTTKDKPGAITGLTSFVFPGTTNLTWINPKNTDYVKIDATPTDRDWGTTSSDVATYGIEGQTGHLFVVDSVSRGVSYKYVLTPYNSAGAGPSATITVRNA